MRVGKYLAGAALLAIPSMGFAQTTEPAQPTDLATDSTTDQQTESNLGDIIVTAQRRSESVQKVPITITAVDSEEISAKGLGSIQSLSLVTPSLVSGSQVGYGQPYIRGIGSDIVTVGTESSVALYVDGIYQSRNLALLNSLGNVERVEVLQGPQGALYGRNATGGVINIVTKSPEKGVTGNLEVGIGNYNRIESKGYIAGGTDSVRGSLAFYQTKHSGYIRNLLTGNRVDRQNDFGVAGKIVFSPSAVDELIITGDYGETGPDAGAYASQFGVGNVTASVVPGAQFTGAPYEIYNNEEGIFNDSDTYSATGRYRHNFPGFDATILGGYRYIRARSSIDIDATSIPFIYFAEPRERTQDYSIEGNLVSTAAGPFSWLAGVNYFVTDGFSYNFIDVIAAQQRVITTANTKTKALAAFGQVDYKFGANDAWQISLGGRYTNERRDIGATQDIFVGPGLPLVASIPAQQDAEFNNFSYSGTLRYNFTNDINAYVKYSTAFKSGSFNVVQPTDPVLGPEKVKAIEGGFKSDLLDRTLRLNAAGFYYDYNNLQIGQITNAGGILYANAAKARIYGVDAQATIAPVAWFRVNLAATYLNAKYRSFPAGSSLTLIPGVVGGVPGNYPAAALGLPNPDLTGNDLTRSPSFSTSIGVDYDLETSIGTFAFSTNGRFTSRYFFDIGNRLEQPAYVLLNGSLTYRPTGDHFYVRAWVNNATQAQNLTFLSATNAGDFGHYADPRTYGATVGVNF